MTDDPAAVLCDAVAAWVTVAALHLDQEKLDVLHACIERGWRHVCRRPPA